MKTVSFARGSIIATSLCVAVAATGCIAGDEESSEQIGEVEGSIVNGVVFDVAPVLVISGEEPPAPNTQKNIALRARYKSVGVLADGWAPKEYWGIGYCTATLVGSHTVLTAAHCFNGMANTNNVFFQIDGKDAIHAKKVKVHPQYQVGKSANDMAVLTLPSNVAGIAPEPINVAYLHAGGGMRLVGYGDYDYKKPDGSIGFKANGTKRLGQNVIDQVEPIFLRYLKTNGGGGSSKGDSGGPLFVDDPAGVDTDVVAGVVAGSDATSGVTSNVSQFAEWIYDQSRGDVKILDPFHAAAGTSYHRQIRGKTGNCLTRSNPNLLTMANCIQGSSTQEWDLQSLGNGTYRIVLSNQCLTGGQPDSCVPGGSPVDAANELRMGQCLSDNLPASCEPYEVKSQGWILAKAGDGTFSIHSLNGLKCLKEGQGPILAKCAGGSAQQWTLH